MAALTKERDTLRRSGESISLAVAGGVRIYAGALVGINSSGFAVPASPETSGIGRAVQTVDNSGGDGDATIDIDKGIFLWEEGDSGNPITPAIIGRVCYAKDDQSVTHVRTGSQAPAGRIFNVTEGGIWVDMR